MNEKPLQIILFLLLLLNRPSKNIVNLLLVIISNGRKASIPTNPRSSSIIPLMIILICLPDEQELLSPSFKLSTNIIHLPSDDEISDIILSSIHLVISMKEELEVMVSWVLM